MTTAVSLALVPEWNKLNGFNSKLGAYAAALPDETWDILGKVPRNPTDYLTLFAQAQKDQQFWEEAAKKASENGVNLPATYEKIHPFFRDVCRFGFFDARIQYQTTTTQIVTLIEDSTGMAKVTALLVKEYAFPVFDDAFKEYVEYCAKFKGKKFDQLLEGISRRNDFWHCVRIFRQNGVTFNDLNLTGLQMRYQSGPQFENEEFHPFDFNVLDATSLEGVVLFDTMAHRMISGYTGRKRYISIE